MTSGGEAFVVLVLVAFGAFALALAFVSWIAGEQNPTS